MNNMSKSLVKFVNLTPHPVHLETDDGLKMTIKPSGKVARVRTETTSLELFLLGTRCIRKILTDVVDNLPDPKPNTLYIVSQLVFFSTDRTDVVAPETSDETNLSDGRKILKRWITKF